MSGQTDLLEFTWHFFDAYRTDCQDIFGGSSGSPVFSAEANTLHALMNTTVEGDTLCYLGAPCEIGDGGVVLNQTSSYATPIHGLANCFDSTGVFTLNATCPFPPVEQLTFITQSPIGQPPLSWAATLTGTLPYYRYKTGEVASVDCRSVEDYSEPIPFSDAPTIDDAIPADEGFYLLCVLAGTGATVDDSWQSPDYPTVAIAQIDTTPPEEPLIDLFESAEFYRITLIFQPPELSDYLFKVGAVEETDCASNDGYFPYRRIPIEIERTGIPLRFCVIGFDHADNATEPLVVDLDTQ